MLYACMALTRSARIPTSQMAITSPYAHPGWVTTPFWRDMRSGTFGIPAENWPRRLVNPSSATGSGPHSFLFSFCCYAISFHFEVWRRVGRTECMRVSLSFAFWHCHSCRCRCCLGQHRFMEAGFHGNILNTAYLPEGCLFRVSFDFLRNRYIPDTGPAATYVRCHFVNRNPLLTGCASIDTRRLCLVGEVAIIRVHSMGTWCLKRR